MICLLLLITIYQLLQAMVLPFIVITLLCINLRRPIIGSFKERLGFIPCAPRNKSVIWLHAVSVGEVLSIQELIHLIKQQNPHAYCYVTVGTITGMTMAKANLKAADTICFLPYDFLPIMLLTYQRIHPAALCIVEAELWPNFLGLARLKKIPLFLLNARINPRSLHRFYRYKIFFKTIIGSFSTIFAQSEEDKKHFDNIGIAPEKITVLGNLKAFNVIAKKERLHHKSGSESFAKKFQVLLVGSMHPHEDVIYLELFTQLQQTHPHLKLILVPRHFGWITTLTKHLTHTGKTFFVWTDHQGLTSSHHLPFEQALEATLNKHDILVVCKLGELFKLYAYANIFYLGGTFVPVGGHNLLEPAAFAIPTIIGPHYGNCTDIANRLEACSGIIKVSNQDELLVQTRLLLENRQLQSTVGRNSFTWICNEAQRVQETLEELLKHIV